MIKKTIFVSNPAQLSLRLNQMVIKQTAVEQSNLHENIKQSLQVTKPIEDIGIVVLENQQISITQALLAALLENNASVICCDNHCMPTGLLLPLAGNTTQSERFAQQISASIPLKKQLWQQTIQAKISNQEAILNTLTQSETGCMRQWAADVKSGDSAGHEARAAAYYWRNLFCELPGLKNFTRTREGEPPNNLLNYGYAILRALMARALVSSGLLPTLGIHHHNRYNAYCLADDIMEPYRPFVDRLVFQLLQEHHLEGITKLTQELKMSLLTIPTLDVIIGGKRSPLMIAASQTTASLYKCFSGEQRKIAFPRLSNISNKI